MAAVKNKGVKILIGFLIVVLAITGIGGAIYGIAYAIKNNQSKNAMMSAVPNGNAQEVTTPSGEVIPSGSGDKYSEQYVIPQENPDVQQADEEVQPPSNFFDKPKPGDVVPKDEDILDEEEEAEGDAASLF